MTTIDAIKARCEAATPGPWENGNGEFINAITRIGSMAICRVNQPVEVAWRSDGSGRTYSVSAQPNKNFIAHAREDIPYLLERIAELEGQLAEVTQIALDVTGKYETSIKMHKITADLLTASQQRERAAVEDLDSTGTCHACKHAIDGEPCYCSECDESDRECENCPWAENPCEFCDRGHAGSTGNVYNWQWRGLQEAGEGER